jgi:hypothetical protein
MGEMSRVLVAVLLLGACKKPDAAPKQVAGAAVVELVTKAGAAPVALDAKAMDALVAHVDRAIAICNFRSDKHGVPFAGMDLATIWSQRAAGPHLAVRYPAPRSFAAIGGTFAATEVMLAIGSAYGPEPALARVDGKILGLEMCGYDDRTLSCAVPELARDLPHPEPCPPFLSTGPKPDP